MQPSAAADRAAARPMPPTTGRETAGWMPTALGGVAHGLLAGVIAFPLAGSVGALAGAFGAAVGALAGVAVAATRLRTWTLWAIAAMALSLVSALHAATAGSEAFAEWLGPSAALRVAEALQLGTTLAVPAFLLRGLSTRRRSLLLLEMAYAVLAFVLLVFAHRQGAIHRPFALADPLLERGLDPTLGLMAVGAVASMSVVLLALRERNPFRWLWHGLVLAIVLLALLAVASVSGLVSPPVKDDPLGLLGDEKDPSAGEQAGHRGGSDALTFRDDYSADQQRFPVGVVLFHDDYSPPLGVYYFRQGAFSYYNGRRLVAALDPEVDRDAALGFPLMPTRVDTVVPRSWARQKVETTVALLADHVRPIGLEAPLEFRPSENPDPQRFRRLYRVWSAATNLDYQFLIGMPVGAASWSEKTRALYRSGPDDPRYRALAERIVRDVLPPELAADPIAQALAIRHWLSEKGTYSLKSQHASATDPTADFLFGDLVGYCVHFSHAAVFLMRSLGLPARVATGYAVDESARQGGSAVLITGQTSHAWPELYVEDIGWLVVDVTPAQALSGAPAPPDPELQRLLAELARGERPLPFDGPEPPKIEEIGEATLSTLSTLALLGALAMISFLYGMKGWRWVAPAFASAASRDRLRYRFVLDRLSDVAHRRRRGEPPAAFAARLVDAYPSLRVITEAHLRSAFGATDKAQAGRIAADWLTTFRGELRRAVPFWRRGLGFLHPWSWLLTR